MARKLEASLQRHSSFNDIAAGAVGLRPNSFKVGGKASFLTTPQFLLKSMGCPGISFNASPHLANAASKFRMNKSLSDTGLRSLRFRGNSQDGTGSIRLGTPVVEPRGSKARHGFLPPEAGRIERSSLSPALLRQVEALYRRMDANSDGHLTKSEAQAFFQRFGKVSAAAMFNEVDEDCDGEVLPSEWRRFWEQVRHNGYSEEDISEELNKLLEGDAWIDFLDDREVGVGGQSKSFMPVARGPSLSPALIRQVESLYRKMDADSDGYLTKQEAQAFFKSFGKLSAGAMFGEVDEDVDGAILPSEWRCFWEQVRSHGYSEEDISAELQELQQGHAWVDFLDGRRVGGASFDRSANNW
eukprot:TRINITY_DN36151_c0_g1_i1.p1 TRINITY_DN36151_c0_g1~~TRINITY_DN36151_c0_g1_i1.p1  ORF type:complete len:368 (-),score=71.10 TRINITY_DN36151_c0_g1_i1:60-1127(-)